MKIELSSEDIEVLRESLELYLTDLRREVAGTENPDMRHQLQRRPNRARRHPDAAQLQSRGL